MANLNLSEFTEKLFVADADHTFIWDTAVSISKRVSRNSWLNSGTLTSDAPVTISQTWAGTGSTVFTALKVNATTTTGSAATAKILDLQHSSLNRFSVQKDGVTTIGASDTGSATQMLKLVNQYGSVDFLIGGGGRLGLWAGNEYISFFQGGILTLNNANSFLGIGTNVILARDGADNTLALRNGAAAQTFNVYGTSSASNANYARLALTCGLDGNATISTQALGTGTAGTVSINGVPVGLGNNNQAGNVSVGTLSLRINTTGTYNTAVGRATLYSNTAGYYNTAVGNGALYTNSTGYQNTAVGEAALDSNSTGATNVAVGHLAGSAAVVGQNTICNNSVFLGVNTKVNATSETNQIVIGYQAIGIGSNSVVLGNDSITKTALKGNVGIGTTSPTSKLHVAETWNAAGTTFAAAKIVVTDTASAAASNLLELWSGSTPALKSYVTKSGSFVGGVVGANQPSALSFPNSGSYSVGIYNPASYKIQFSMSSADPGGVAAGAYSGLQYEMTAGVLSWGTTAQDIILLRDGEADHLAMRRSTNGQKFSVYGTYPGAAWERFTITAPTSGNVLLGTYKGTGGIARGLEFQTDGASRWSISTAGHLLAATDNAYDIGANGANRPRNVYAAGNVSGVTGLHSGGTSLITFSNSTSLTYAENGAYHVALQRNGNGILALLQSGGGWDRLQLGGTTDAFPAVARDGAGIKFTGAAAGSTAWIKVPPVAVSALPLAATAGAGARAFVNDALAPTFGSAVTGGGSGLVPVYSDGSAWNVG